MSIKIRPVTPADIEVCGRILHEAFKGIAEQHRFPIDFPSVEFGIQAIRGLTSHPKIFGVVAESDSQVVGSSFLHERDEVRGIGPISVDPNTQQRGVGRALMEAMIARSQGSLSLRLVQDAFNTASLSLYASVGFDVKEPLALVQGKPKSQPSTRMEVRLLQSADLDQCAALCRKIHGFERTSELRDVLKLVPASVFVGLRDGHIRGYLVLSDRWTRNHGMAETEEEMRSLIGHASVQSAEPTSFLLPTRQASFFRWCLSEGFRVIKPMTLMAMGEYQEPRGCFFPTVLY